MNDVCKIFRWGRVNTQSKKCPCCRPSWIIHEGTGDRSPARAGVAHKSATRFEVKI
jgi:hypothetical protein